MTQKPVSASLSPRRNSQLCFQRAFPGTAAEHRAAVAELAGSGARDEPVYYRFSFDVARWLARRAPNAVSIDWPELEDTELLDNLLRRILHPAEDEYFDSGDVGTREWMDMARAGFDGTDFDWLMAQLSDKRFESFYRELYDAADGIALPILPLPAWTTGRRGLITLSIPHQNRLTR